MVMGCLLVGLRGPSRPCLRPHAWISHPRRRAYSQALADANVSAQQAQALAGHALLDAHQRYLLNTSKMRELPEAALPQIRVLPLRGANNQGSAGATKGKSPEISGLSGLRGRDLNQRNLGVVELALGR